MTLTTIQIEDGRRHQLGDLVTINSSAPWACDWKGIVGEVIGICWDTRKQDWNITLRHDADYITDDFRVDDLRRAALADGDRSLSGEEKL